MQSFHWKENVRDSHADNRRTVDLEGYRISASNSETLYTTSSDSLSSDSLSSDGLTYSESMDKDAWDVGVGGYHSWIAFLSVLDEVIQSHLNQYRMQQGILDVNGAKRDDKRRSHRSISVVTAHTGESFTLLNTLRRPVKTRDGDGTQKTVIEKKILGQGATGKVRYAQDDQGRDYAVKKITLDRLQHLSSSHFFVEQRKDAHKLFDRFKQEGYFHQKCQERCGQHATYYAWITRQIEIVNSKGRPVLYQFSPLLEHDAQVYLDLNLSSEDMLIHASQNLTLALRNLHQHHIYHRDIKPDNLLFAPHGDIVMADFGSAAMYEKGVLLDQVSTNIYVRHMSPEFYCLERGEQKDRLLDTWQLGLTLLQFASVEARVLLKEAHTSSRLNNQFFNLIWHYHAEVRRQGVQQYGTPQWVSGYRAFKLVHEEAVIRHLNALLKDVHPVLAEVIKGFLHLDHTERLTTDKAYEKLKSLSYDGDAVKACLDYASDCASDHYGSSLRP